MTRANSRIRLGITSKLTLAIVAVSVLAVIAMSVGSRITFTHGFIGYLNEAEMARVDLLVPKLRQGYQIHGNWDYLRNDSQAWANALELTDASGADLVLPPNSQVSQSPTATTRIALLDTEGRLIAGTPNIKREFSGRDVVVDGRVVGWLGAVPVQMGSRTAGAAYSRFLKRHLYTTWLIAIATVMLVGALAFWMARRLLNDLQEVTRSVQRLADGDYSVRAPTASRDEIGVLAENCNYLAGTLQMTEDMRRRFMADVSHELRTPLAVLRGELEALEDGVRAPTVSSIHSLQAEVATLSKLVNDLHSLFVADNGVQAFRMERTDIREPLNLTLATFRERLADRGVRLEATLDANESPVFADSDRLGQLFSNILENVLRYASSGGYLRVECSRKERHALLTFEDAGPGVPEELLPRIFERFYRVEGSRNRSGGGTGLGLAICKSIVQAHAGTIGARRSVQGGLCIQISLPTSA
ncbi:MAG: ATP-binding protein [Steroidobacteraceae bacterium]